MDHNSYQFDITDRTVKGFKTLSGEMDKRDIARGIFIFCKYNPVSRYEHCFPWTTAATFVMADGLKGEIVGVIFADGTVEMTGYLDGSQVTTHHQFNPLTVPVETVIHDLELVISWVRTWN